MTQILFYLLSVTVCSGLMVLYYLLALRNNLFHQWNRFYLLFSVLISLFLPLIKFTVQSEPDDGNNGWAMLLKMGQFQQSIQEEINTENIFSLQEPLLLGFYSCICGLLALRFIFSIHKVVKLIRKSSVQKLNVVKLVITNEQDTPFSFLDYIFWNQVIKINSDEGKQIFQHELVHIKEKHSHDKIFMQLILVFFWINPFFWIIKRELNCVHEFIADAKSIHNKDTNVFAALILQTAMPGYYNELINPFFKTAIKRRMIMLTKQQNPILNYAARLAVLPLVAMTTMAFTLQTEKDNGENGILIDKPITVSLKTFTDTIPGKSDNIQRVDVDKKNKKVQITYKDGTVKEMNADELKDKKQLKNEYKDHKSVTKKEGGTDKKPLYLVDGNEYKGDLEEIDPTTIESVNVLKGEAALQQHGEKGRHGVIEIKLKKATKKS